MIGIGGITYRARTTMFLGFMVACALGATISSAAARERTAPVGKTYTWSFQSDTLGQKPAHTMAFGGTWQVSEDSTGLAPSTRVLSQSEDNDGITFHYLTFTRPLLEDLDASVRFRIRSGEIDPSAGLLFQMDPKGTSGYLVRVSAKTGELVFHYLLYGKRRDVKFAKIGPLEPGTWHTIAITRRRSVTQAFFDGNVAMRVRDDRFWKGTVGVWTEDDTLVDFRDLVATAR